MCSCLPSNRTHDQGRRVGRFDWLEIDHTAPTEAGHFQPRAPSSWLGLGDCFYALKLYDQALFRYQHVTDLVPRHELALERQRACSPKLFGLMRAFRKPDPQTRWKEEYRKLTRPTGPYDY